MKETFRDNLHLNKENIKKLKIINDIIEEYAKQGYKLTLRQLYYQLVSRGIIPNKIQEYAKLSVILVKGRMAGIVDWEAIEDRIRVPFIPYWVTGISDAINDTINQYRLNRQKGQKNYIELWVEKDALSGVLRTITSRYHINLMVNRGYSSCTAMHDAYERFLKVIINKNQNVKILYLGDHDPSGLDMIRDIKDRIMEFLTNSIGLQDNNDLGSTFEIIPIGLTMEQIKQFNPPPNPAKITDTRAKWYIKEYGNKSWEVDALSPKVLHSLVKKNVENLINIGLFNKMVEKEEIDRNKLRKLGKEEK